MSQTLMKVIEERREFMPQFLSDDENEFLCERLGQNPAVALEGGDPVPAPVAVNSSGQPIPHKGGGVTMYRYTLESGRVVTVNRKLMRQVMEQLRDLEDAAASGRGSWCGYEAIKQCVRFWMDKYRAEFKRLKEMDPKLQHPSRFAYDSRGRAIYQGIGSDSREVRTWIDKEGKRREFGIPLTKKPPSFGGNWFAGLGAPAKDPEQIDELVERDPEALQSDVEPGERMSRMQIVQDDGDGPKAPTASDQPAEAAPEPVEGVPEAQQEVVEDPIVEDAPTELIFDEDKCRVECPLCGHTETYKDGNLASKNLARARMSRHLTKTTEDVEAHRRLKYEVFGG